MIGRYVGRRGAGVLLVDGHDNVLLTYTRLRYAWEHPGGLLHWREKRATNGSLTCALRELKEETSVVAGPYRVVNVHDDAPLGIPFTSFVVRLPYTPRIELNRRELVTYRWVPVWSARYYVRPELAERFMWLRNANRT